MRPRRASTAIPLLVLAPIGLLVACNDRDEGSGGSTAQSSEGPSGTGGIETVATSGASGTAAVDGPALADVVQATLDQGSIRYLMTADATASSGDLVQQLLGSTDVDSTATDSTATDSTATDSTATDSTATDSTATDSTTTGGTTTEGCDLQPSARPEGVADTEQGVRCIVLPDGTQVVIADRDIHLGADGVWSLTTVQFDQALVQLDSEQLVALHDPTAVLDALAAGSVDAAPTDGPHGLEYQVTLPIAEVDDPFLVALAQRAGAQSVTVHVHADPSGEAVLALGYEFAQAAQTTGGATGSGTGGTTDTAPGSETTNGAPQNPAGGGNGSTTSAVPSLPDSGSTTVPSDLFEDVPAVAVVFTASGEDVRIELPAEPAPLPLGDLAASLEIDLGQG